MKKKKRIYITYYSNNVYIKRIDITYYDMFTTCQVDGRYGTHHSPVHPSHPGSHIGGYNGNCSRYSHQTHTGTLLHYSQVAL